jgi:hypothetical protein
MILVWALTAISLAVGCTSQSKPASPGRARATATATTTAATTTASATGAAPTTTATPVIPADVPRVANNPTKAGETPPMPPVLGGHAAQAAIYFAEFFIKTIDWAYATTSTTYMKHYYEQTCVECRSIDAGISTAARKGHRFVGDRITIKRSELVTPNDLPLAEISILIRYDVTSVEVLDKNGRFVAADVAHHFAEHVGLRWRSGGWRVVDLAPVR